MMNMQNLYRTLIILRFLLWSDEAIMLWALVMILTAFLFSTP
jgi:hypothetical protein